MKVQLRNRFTGRRERTIELDGFRHPERVASIGPHDVFDDPREMLRGLGFNIFETEYLMAYIVEDLPLRALPERLDCTKRDVERLRASTNRIILRLRYEAAMRESAYENLRFGTG